MGVHISTYLHRCLICLPHLPLCTCVFHATLSMSVLAYVHTLTYWHTQMHRWHHEAHMNVHALSLFFHPSLLSHRAQQKRAWDICKHGVQMDRFLSDLQKTDFFGGVKGGHLFALSHLILVTTPLFFYIRRGQDQVSLAFPKTAHNIIKTREERSEFQYPIVQLGIMCPPRECPESTLACTTLVQARISKGHHILKGSSCFPVPSPRLPCRGGREGQGRW